MKKINEMIETVPIDSVLLNQDNPRILKDDKFKKLVKSVKEFPQMLQIRPIVVNSEMVVLGGNMRLQACKKAGLTEVTIIKADNLTEEHQKEFIIKDNVGFGEWDWDVLANEWDVEQVEEWGLDLPLGNFNEDEDENYSNKIESPTYEPENAKPDFSELIDEKKTKELIKEIDESAINEEDKHFLRLAAFRHTVFNYKKVADFYANSDKDVQGLMENSGLIIIDFKKAIEKGYVQLSEEIAESFVLDYGE